MSHFTKQPSRQILSRLFASLLLFLITAVPLYAHHLPPGMEDVDEFDEGAAFMAGLRHPLLGMDHWLFAIIIGAVAAAGVTRFARFSPVTSLLIGVIGGAALGLNAVIVPGALMAGLAVLMIVIVMPSSRMHWSVLKLLLIGLGAFWQGNQHGIAWPLDSGGAWYVAGLIVSTTVLAISGAFLQRLTSNTVRLPRHARVTSH
jgi:urease accessory protein